MGQLICGVAVKGKIEVSKKIVHFYRLGDTMIILDLHFWDIERFAKICEYGFLAKADFSDNWEISQLSKILPGHSFVVFYYSEWAELIDQQYSVIFKDGVYQKCDEIVYRSFDSIGISYDFVNETRYFSYYNAKESYLTTEQ